MAAIEPPQIPLSVVQKIFTRLTLSYGRRFMSLWDGLNIDDVRLRWARDLHWLAKYEDARQIIREALDALPPGAAPDLPTFSNLCRQAARSRSVVEAVEEIPKMSPERLAELRELAAQIGRPKSPGAVLENLLALSHSRPPTIFQIEAMRDLAAVAARRAEPVALLPAPSEQETRA